MPAGGRTVPIDRHLQDTVDVLRRPGAVTEVWREAWSDQRFRAEAVLSPLALVVVLAVMAHFLSWVEHRPGVVLTDPVLDPLVQVFGTGEVLTRDLFFSGHTATLALLALLAPGRTSRRFFVVCTLLVAVCVLWQHVHYTVDVLVAPFFAFASRELVFALHPGLRRSRLR